jgi:nucleoside 2-deoxyribosyltransferase
VSNSERVRAYLAGPLFSAAEKAFNLLLASKLDILLDLYLPQRDGGLIVDLVDRGVDIGAASRSIFDRDRRAIEDSDLFIAILDGRSVDEGAAFELGYAFALGKRCVGLQTDSRRLLPLGNNPMIQGALTHVFATTEDLFKYCRTLRLHEHAGLVADDSTC